jgi:hypothetical protein
MGRTARRPCLALLWSGPGGEQGFAAGSEEEGRIIRSYAVMTKLPQRRYGP